MSAISLIGQVAWLILPCCHTCQPAEQPSETPKVMSRADGERIAWLGQHAIPLRSIDPEEEDFKDLEPLKAAIGNARIVALGEQTHGDGATFLAKCRLVKFLHQEMGFDVLAWESGLYECREMDRALADASIPVVEASQRGAFAIWTLSAQAQPVFRYCRETFKTDRPLEMAGFDHQFSAATEPPHWLTGIVEFFDAADPGMLPADLRTAFVPLGTGRAFSQHATGADIRELQMQWKRLPPLFESGHEKLVGKHGAAEVEFMRRATDDAIISLECMAQYRESKRDVVLREDPNLRDRRMGENLIWLANERYKGRKIILWAATMHLVRKASAIELPADWGMSYQDVVTMGEVADATLKEQMYIVGFVGHDGRAGLVTMGRYTWPVEPAPAGSLEAMCKATGKQLMFVPLRGQPEGHWLRGSISARPLGNSDMLTDWSRQLDAFVYTEKLFPSTKENYLPAEAIVTVDP